AWVKAFASLRIFRMWHSGAPWLSPGSLPHYPGLFWRGQAKMRGCLAVLAFIAGSGAVHGLPMLPSAGAVRWLLMFLAVLATLLLASIVLMWRRLTHGANLPGWWNTGLCA